VPTQIGNSLSKQFVHQLRSEEHAILVGTNTAVTDNPSLTTREIKGRNPVRILIDFDLKIPNDFKIFNSEAETIIFNSVKEEQSGNLKFIKIEKENFIDNLLAKLYELQIQSVIVEGGKFTLQQFIDENLWDECIIITNENLNLINGTSAPKFSATPFKTEILRDNLVSFYRNY
jgi:diaminohydroxyphosphoribosylaminopyrimidine deaminase/5-amino-6-(5-phosphoribosylamino)uracil reductase